MGGVAGVFVMAGKQVKSEVTKAEKKEFDVDKFLNDRMRQVKDEYSSLDALSRTKAGAVSVFVSAGNTRSKSYNSISSNGQKYLEGILAEIEKTSKEVERLYVAFSKDPSKENRRSLSDKIGKAESLWAEYMYKKELLIRYYSAINVARTEEFRAVAGLDAELVKSLDLVRAEKKEGVNEVAARLETYRKMLDAKFDLDPAKLFSKDKGSLSISKECEEALIFSANLAAISTGAVGDVFWDSSDYARQHSPSDKKLFKDYSYQLGTRIYDELHYLEKTKVLEEEKKKGRRLGPRDTTSTYKEIPIDEGTKKALSDIYTKVIYNVRSAKTPAELASALGGLKTARIEANKLLGKARFESYVGQDWVSTGADMVALTAAVVYPPVGGPLALAWFTERGGIMVYQGIKDNNTPMILNGALMIGMGALGAGGKVLMAGREAGAIYTTGRVLMLSQKTIGAYFMGYMGWMSVKAIQDMTERGCNSQNIHELVSSVAFMGLAAASVAAARPKIKTPAPEAPIEAGVGGGGKYNAPVKLGVAPKSVPRKTVPSEVAEPQPKLTIKGVSDKMKAGTPLTPEEQAFANKQGGFWNIFGRSKKSEDTLPGPRQKNNLEIIDETIKEAEQSTMPEEELISLKHAKRTYEMALEQGPSTKVDIAFVFRAMNEARSNLGMEEHSFSNPFKAGSEPLNTGTQHNTPDTTTNSRSPGEAMPTQKTIKGSLRSKFNTESKDVRTVARDAKDAIDSTLSDAKSANDTALARELAQLESARLKAETDFNDAVRTKKFNPKADKGQAFTTSELIQKVRENFSDLKAKLESNPFDAVALKEAKDIVNNIQGDIGELSARHPLLFRYKALQKVKNIGLTLLHVGKVGLALGAIAGAGYGGYKGLVEDSKAENKAQLGDEYKFTRNYDDTPIAFPGGKFDDLENAEKYSFKTDSIHKIAVSLNNLDELLILFGSKKLLGTSKDYFTLDITTTERTVRAIAGDESLPQFVRNAINKLVITPGSETEKLKAADDVNTLFNVAKKLGSLGFETNTIASILDRFELGSADLSKLSKTMEGLDPKIFNNIIANLNQAGIDYNSMGSLELFNLISEYGKNPMFQLLSGYAPVVAEINRDPNQAISIFNKYAEIINGKFVDAKEFNSVMATIKGVILDLEAQPIDKVLQLAVKFKLSAEVKDEKNKLVISEGSNKKLLKSMYAYYNSDFNLTAEMFEVNTSTSSAAELAIKELNSTEPNYTRLSSAIKTMHDTGDAVKNSNMDIDSLSHPALGRAAAIRSASNIFIPETVLYQKLEIIADSETAKKYGPVFKGQFAENYISSKLTDREGIALLFYEKLIRTKLEEFDNLPDANSTFAGDILKKPFAEVYTALNKDKKKQLKSYVDDNFNMDNFEIWASFSNPKMVEAVKAISDSVKGPVDANKFKVEPIEGNEEATKLAKREAGIALDLETAKRFKPVFKTEDSVKFKETAFDLSKSENQTLATLYLRDVLGEAVKSFEVEADFKKSGLNVAYDKLSYAQKQELNTVVLDELTQEKFEAWLKTKL